MGKRLRAIGVGVLAGLVVFDWLLHWCLETFMSGGECLFAFIAVLFVILPWVTLWTEGPARRLSDDVK